MRVETVTTWWNNDDKGVWSMINNTHARRIPEVVISLHTKSILSTGKSNVSKVVFALTLNSYTKKKVSIPNILNGMKPVSGLKLDIEKLEVETDNHGIVNTKWSKGKYLLTRSLPEKSTVTILLTVKITDNGLLNGEYTLEFDEKKMSDSSPSLFAPVKVVDFAPFEIIHTNQILYTYSNDSKRKSKSIIRVGSFDTFYNGRSLKVKTSKVRIDYQKSVSDGKEVHLMTMNEDKPFYEYKSLFNSKLLDTEPVNTVTKDKTYNLVFPVLFICDNTELVNWWYKIGQDGSLTILCPEEMLYKGNLSSTTFEIF